MAKAIGPNPPSHLGLIMDGNRRWAKAHGLPSLEGHRRGYKKLHEIALYSLVHLKIPYISAFVFSTENWSRTQPEVKYLMGLIRKAMNDYLEEFHQHGVRIQVLGSRDKLDLSVVRAVEKAQSVTASNTNGTLCLCFNYGGQEEIVAAVKKIIASKIESKNITPKTLASNLYGDNIPPLDLIIRTSGEQRLSGFMLWRSAYSELLFVNKHWPDFTTEDIDDALWEYSKRQRRYGK